MAVDDPPSRSARYFRNAVETHWDPAAVDLSADPAAVADLSDGGFDSLRSTLALFGVGEEAVTEDLLPLALVTEDLADQQYLTSQLYDEARHKAFFDRYWREVVHPAEDERGLDRTSPRADRWFPDAYLELLDRTATAMDRLLDEDTPENRARALVHYHLTVEGILAQAAYYGLTTNFGPEVDAVPHLPGLVDGITSVRRDEGRHVGYGMAKLKDLVGSDAVDEAVVHETVTDLVPLTQGTVTDAAGEGYGSTESDLLDGTDLATYAAEKHVERMNQITDDERDLPSVEELVALD